MFFFSEENISTFKPNSVEHAYLAILNGEIDVARRIFDSLDSPSSNWGLTLTDILSTRIEHFPTYFEIRNFLEIDLNFLIKNEKIELVELLLGSLEYLSKINNETYKYVARVMIENGLDVAAEKYLEKAKKTFYNDVESHFLYSKYYLDKNEYRLAYKYIKECLNFLPDYYPARKLQEEILKHLA